MKKPDVKQIMMRGRAPKRHNIDPKLVAEIVEEIGLEGRRVQIRTHTRRGEPVWYLVDTKTCTYIELSRPRASVATWPREASN